MAYHYDDLALLVSLARRFRFAPLPRSVVYFYRPIAKSGASDRIIGLDPGDLPGRLLDEASVTLGFKASESSRFTSPPNRRGVRRPEGPAGSTCCNSHPANCYSARVRDAHDNPQELSSHQQAHNWATRTALGQAHSRRHPALLRPSRCNFIGLAGPNSKRCDDPVVIESSGDRPYPSPIGEVLQAARLHILRLVRQKSRRGLSAKIY